MKSYPSSDKNYWPNPNSLQLSFSKLREWEKSWEKKTHLKTIAMQTPENDWVSVSANAGGITVNATSKCVRVRRDGHIYKESFLAVE